MTLCHPFLTGRCAGHGIGHEGPVLRLMCKHPRLGSGVSRFAPCTVIPGSRLVVVTRADFQGTE